MEPQTIPLALASTARGPAYAIGSSAKDEQLINGFLVSAANPALQSKALYVEKRQGSANATSIGTTPRVLRNCGGLGPLFIAGAGENLYNSLATDLGIIGGFPASGSACGGIVGTKQVIAFPAASFGWYLWDDAISTNFPTFTGNLNSNTVIDGIASTTGIYPGQRVTHANIPGGTRVATITSATAITISAAATATAAGQTITKEAVARINSSNFPSGFCSYMEFIDGYFIADSQNNARIRNSSLNDPNTWAAEDYLVLDYGSQVNSPFAVSMFKKGASIVVGCNDMTVQHFRVGQNTTGSILSRAMELNKTGLLLQSLYPALIGGALYLLAATGASSADKALYRIADGWERISDNNWSAVFSALGASVLGTMENGLKTLAFIGNQTGVNGVAYDQTNNQFSVISTPTAVLSTELQNFTRASLSNFVQWNSDTSGLWTDSTAAFTFTAQTKAYFMNGGLPFGVLWIDLIADTQASGTATLQASADDGATWRTIGTFDLTSQQKRLYRGGFYKSNVMFRLTHSADTPFRAEALNVQPYRVAMGRTA